MISEGSCDTEDTGVMMLKIQVCHHRKFHRHFKIYKSFK